MKKRYYNSATNDWLTAGQSVTRRLTDGSIFVGIPTEEMLQEWGYEEWQAPEPAEPTEEDLARQRMQEIQDELASMDYLTSKYIDGEDMSEYGDWQGRRKALREEYRELEKELNNNGI